MRKLENGNVVLETSTSIWPIVCCGTYDGQPCDYDALFGGDIDDDHAWSVDGDHTVRADDFDFGKWKEAIRDELNGLLEDEFPTSTNRFGVWIGPVKATEISSPRQYNFTTDCALLDVEVQTDFAGKALSFLSGARDDDAMRRRIDMWIEDHWKSRDGFSSWMPQSWDEFVERATELDAAINDVGHAFWEAQTAGAVLTLLAVCSDAYAEDDCGLGSEGGVDFLTEELQEGLLYNHCYDEFVSTWRFSELAEKLSESGVDPVDFGKERRRMDREWRSLLDSLPERPSWNDPVFESRRKAGSDLQDAMEEQDRLLVEWAMSAPGSQEEFNALGRLRRFTDDYRKGERR